MLSELEKENLEKAGFLIPIYPLTNFETYKYYQSEPKFNCGSSRNVLCKVNQGVYVIEQ